MNIILSTLNLLPHDVPGNGDCFYLAVQLYLSHVLSPPIHLPASELRHHTYSLLNSFPTGSQILLNYNLTPSTITSNILPSLKPAHFPTRDTYASDYAIAAMATLFQSPITVYALSDSNIPLKHTYLPYTPSEYASHLHRPTMNITVLHSLSHFQLLLPYNLPLHPLPSKLLGLPRLPPTNITPHNLPVIINTPFHLLLSYLLPPPMPQPLHCFPSYRSTTHLIPLHIGTNHPRNHSTPHPHMHSCRHNPSHPITILHPNHPITSLRRHHLPSTSKTPSQPPYPQLLHCPHQHSRTYSSPPPIPPCI